jgi:hypothetical protein
MHGEQQYWIAARTTGEQGLWEINKLGHTGSEAARVPGTGWLTRINDTGIFPISADLARVPFQSPPLFCF